jgi:hypothetical protein
MHVAKSVTPILLLGERCCRFDPQQGNMWVTGEPLSRFVPETGKFTNYWETGHICRIFIWFTITDTPGQVVKMDLRLKS